MLGCWVLGDGVLSERPERVGLHSLRDRSVFLVSDCPWSLHRIPGLVEFHPPKGFPLPCCPRSSVVLQPLHPHSALCPGLALLAPLTVGKLPPAQVASLDLATKYTLAATHTHFSHPTHDYYSLLSSIPLHSFPFLSFSSRLNHTPSPSPLLSFPLLPSRSPNRPSLARAHRHSRLTSTPARPTPHAPMT